VITGAWKSATVGTIGLGAIVVKVFATEPDPRLAWFALAGVALLWVNVMIIEIRAGKHHDGG